MPSTARAALTSRSTPHSEPGAGCNAPRSHQCLEPALAVVVASVLAWTGGRGSGTSAGFSTLLGFLHWSRWCRMIRRGPAGILASARALQQADQ